MRPVTILLVDDERSVRAALAQTLQGSEVRVVEAEDSVAAFKMLRKEPIGIVIADHHMPGIKGLEFLALLREQFPDVIRIMLTGHTEYQVALRAVNEGQLFRFLEKPCSPAELRITIHMARERLELERENRHLLALVRSNPELLRQVQLEELRRGTKL